MYRKFIFLICLISFLVSPILAKAQELTQDEVEIVKAKVLSVKNLGDSTLPGLDVTTQNQELTAKILEGNKEGETVVFENDYIQLKKGDRFYLSHIIRSDTGSEVFAVSEPYRLPIIYFLVIFFIVLVLLVGGKQGLRGIISLGGGLALILYVLIPGILQGYSPVLVSIVVSSLIIVLGSYVTHGFNKTTSSAVFGMIITVIITGLMAYFSVHLSELSGYGSDEAFYLNLNFNGQIDLIGILISGIMIGLLGVLYDVAIGQAISVEELHKIAPHIPRKTIYKRALRIGREHIGALVNTLAIAYVGASLPLLLLFSTPPVDVGLTINKEIFAGEIVRALIGSIGLVLAVPITTLLSTIMLIKKPKNSVPENNAILEKEKESLEHYEHKH